MAIRILLADDHALVRAGLARLIADFPGCEVVGEAGDGNEAERLARALAPDVVLLDITMPKRNGLDACKEITQRQPGTGVVLLSMHTAEDFIQRGFASGAKGYVCKSAVPLELEQAVRTVARGGIYLCSRLSTISGRAIGQTANGAPGAAADALSARQREVLWLIAQGNSTRAIAEQLHLSVKTIETHRAQIMRRTGIDNVAGLTRYAMRMGLIPPEH